MNDTSRCDCRGVGFKANGGEDTRSTEQALRDHNGPEKPGRDIAPKGADVPIASPRGDLAFTHDGSLRAVPRDVLGRQSSSTTLHDDKTNARVSTNPRSAVSSRIYSCNCPGVSYGVLPPGRTDLSPFSASTGRLWGVSWGSSPQPGYKRASVCAGVCMRRIVASNPRTPRTRGVAAPISGSTGADTGGSVSHPGAGHYRTPQDRCPGCPTPNRDTCAGWSE